jgi:hypothetical protein
MNRIILLFATIMITISAAGQMTGEIKSALPQDNAKINNTFFILGTLSDDHGRFYYVNKIYQVDKYYPYEKSLMSYLKGLIRNEFNTKLIADDLETFSPKVAARLNSFYGKDNLLTDSIFQTREEYCSFITGRYYRYGRRLNDSIYKIQVANSPNHKIIDDLLKKTGCKKIQFKYLDSNPEQFIYYFIPPMELRGYFDHITGQKLELDNAYNETVRKKLGLSESEYIKVNKELDEKETREIIDLFNRSSDLD